MLLLKPELRNACSAHKQVSEVEVTGTQREEYGYSKFSNSKNLPCVTRSAKHQCVKEYNSQNPRKHEDHQREVRLKGPFFTQPSVNHEDPSAPRRSPSSPAGSGILFC